MNLYKKPFPKRTFDESVIDVLRLSEAQWAQYQNVARHYLGERHFHDQIPKLPPGKLLRSSLETIRDVDSKNTLAGLLHVEHAAHIDPNINFHKGGGLWETSRSIFSGLWSLIGFGPEFDRMYESLPFVKPKNRETPYDRYLAKIVDESYQPIDKRNGKVGHWIRLPEFDTRKFSVWEDPQEKRIHVALKGTTAHQADIWSDIHILANNKSGHEGEIKQYLQDVVTKLGDTYTYDASGHSLGGTELINVFTQDDALLDKYDRVSVFTPGITPTHSLGNVKEALGEDKFHFFLNTGDILSNAVVSLVTHDSNVAYGDPTHSIGHNHGLDQFIGDVVGSDV